MIAKTLSSCSLSALENRDLQTAFPGLSPDQAGSSVELESLAGARASITRFGGFWICS